MRDLEMEDSRGGYGFFKMETIENKRFSFPLIYFLKGKPNSFKSANPSSCLLAVVTIEISIPRT